MANIFRILAVLFFSLSIIPIVQILVASLNNYLVIYLMCILGLWILLRNFLENLIQVFGVCATFSSIMVSFFVPLLVLNINGIRIHELLFPITFFVFLEISAFKLIGEFNRRSEKSNNPGYISLNLGYFSLLRVIPILIPFGFLTCFFLLLLQGRYQLFKLLMLTIPLAALMVFKINQHKGDQRDLARIINSIAFIFVLMIEGSWIVGLWLHL